MNGFIEHNVHHIYETPKQTKTPSFDRNTIC